MSKFLKSLKRQEGFTLVELMVVVAIIGLLSAVAVPNFKKYQAKAKLSEAKLQLSAAYTAEVAFFTDFNIYHNCLAYMGFNPAGEISNRYFATGFTSAANIDTTAYSAAVNSGLLAASCAMTQAAADGTTYFTAGKGIGANIANSAAFLGAAGLTTTGTQASSATMTFVMGAAGVIDSSSVTNANCALVTMDQSKVMSVIRNGF